MGVNNNIQNALTTKLSQVPNIPTIAYANAKYTPAEGQDYIRPTLIPAKSELYSLQTGRHSGIYQIDIFVSLNKGTSPLLLLADSIRDAFKNAVLTSDVDTVYIQAISISTAQRVEGWWSCFVQIDYFCFN